MTIETAMTKRWAYAVFEIKARSLKADCDFEGAYAHLKTLSPYHLIAFEELIKSAEMDLANFARLVKNIKNIPIAMTSVHLLLGIEIHLGVVSASQL
ncbi:hypothetical protein PS928_04340 [Pseudomonas fluorescens]|uniref:Uncharacterized protein n=1 Tax=Pseudomonas fluorescens TaxID=294 RepID=A0A5E7V8V3_PSEFL|nr:hypothetical protein PS928_04340 [Pseudomonas fluorescens]